MCNRARSKVMRRDGVVARSGIKVACEGYGGAISTGTRRRERRQHPVNQDGIIIAACGENGCCVGGRIGDVDRNFAFCCAAVKLKTGNTADRSEGNIAAARGGNRDFGKVCNRVEGKRIVMLNDVA